MPPIHNLPGLLSDGRLLALNSYENRVYQIGRERGDPAFPFAFPWFGEHRYWEDMILNLREQLGRMHERALVLPH